MSRCQQELREAGQAYPRTCEMCGLTGPCRKGAPFAKDEVTKVVERMDQPKVTGYRKLSDHEAQLMNEVKALGQKIEGHIAQVQSHLRTQRAEALGASPDTRNETELARLDYAQPERWAAMARSDFQVALMELVRAIAQPSSF